VTDKSRRRRRRRRSSSSNNIHVFMYVADFVRPICLPFDDTAPDRYIGEELVATGWGRTETSE
jgi:hypothetical protein